MDSLTREKLARLFSYDPDTGHFKRLVVTSSAVSVGDIAGCVSQSGYHQISIDGRQYRAHRLAFLYMIGRWPFGHVDHINGVRGDNRWINLREATHAQNQRNRRHRKDNSSGFKGVSWINRPNAPWRVQIRSDGCERRYVGSYHTKEEAARAYDEAARQLHGEFAVTNESLGLLPPSKAKENTQ